jgi:hypothetical protein
MPAFLIGLFALGTIGFWILIPLAVIFLFFMVEHEKPGWATLSLIFVGLVLAYFGDVNLWFIARENPMSALLMVVSYFGMGALWSIGKWWFLVRERRSNYQDFRDEFMKYQKLDPKAEIPNELKKTFKERIEGRTKYNGGDKPISKPLIREHKGILTLWMTYWPWSMTWTLLNDPVKKAFRWVLDQLQGVYQRIADSIFKGVEKDIAYVESKVKDEGIVEEH